MTQATQSRVKFSNPIATSFRFELGEGRIVDAVEGVVAVIWDEDPLSQAMEYDTSELIELD